MTTTFTTVTDARTYLEHHGWDLVVDSLVGELRCDEVMEALAADLWRAERCVDGSLMHNRLEMLSIIANTMYRLNIVHDELQREIDALRQAVTP